MSNQPQALYRFYDATGQLLYVGITADPGARWPSHAREKTWWHEVRGITVETYPDRGTVLAAETRAIAVEHPRYNLQRPSLPSQRHSAPTAPRAALVWVCEACRGPVPDGDGYIHVRHADVHQVEAAERAWRSKYEPDPDTAYISLAAYQEFPQPAHWQTHHRVCDPQPESFDYHFDVARARTHADLLHWTAHLMEKNWLKHTDWLQLIDRMAGVNP